MTLIQLKYFQTICKYNNITRASAELHVSQPSLSNAVKELEREFGVSLFTRRSRGLELTPEGRYFLDEADKLLEQAEQLTTNMKHMSTTDRTLTLGLPAMSGSLVFTDLLRTLYARSPGTHIQVMENGSLANRSKMQPLSPETDRSLRASAMWHCVMSISVCICLSCIPWLRKIP